MYHLSSDKAAHALIDGVAKVMNGRHRNLDSAAIIDNSDIIDDDIKALAGEICLIFDRDRPDFKGLTRPQLAQELNTTVTTYLHPKDSEAPARPPGVTHPPQ